MTDTAQSQSLPNVAAIIVAAGRGTRLGGEIPKQYQLLGGEPVLTRTIRALARASISAMLVSSRFKF